MLRNMEKSLKLKIGHKLLLYVILLFTIRCHHQRVNAFQYATVALKTLQLNETVHSSQRANDSSSPTPNHSDETLTGSYDLVLHEGSDGVAVESTTSQRQEQLAKHTYNVTRTIAPSASPLANSDGSSVVSNKTEGDDLNVSDSRLIAKSVNAKRSDEDVGDYMPGEDEVQPDLYNGASALDNYADAASSDQIEQKVMKELTKLLSKGMAGATDKVKLEKLERWKRRQKERKVMKDNRAKLFEDLLTAAINTHPEETKKKSKKRTGVKESDGGKISKSSMPILGDALQNVDPELAQDAESVLQHLQGVSAVFETPSPIESIDEASGSGEADSAEDNKDTESASNRKTSTDRPLIRSFKKIKQQFKHRRNQLDQIKKIFNVELAINPKDGSLVGKTSNKKKDYREVGEFNIYDDSTGSENPSTSRSGIKKKANKMSKMNELSAYLMENPEILASVMAELTVDSDPSRPSMDSSSTSLSSSDNSHVDYSSDQPRLSAVSRKFSSLGHHYKAIDNDRLSIDSQPNAKNPFNSLNLSNDLDPSEFTQRLGNRYRRHNSNYSLQSSSSSYAPGGVVYNEKIRNTIQTVSPTETMLLKTLRERQLMNLMRLEMLMAERQQSSSNRSNSYAERPVTFGSQSSAPLAPPSGLDEREGESSSLRSSSTNKYPQVQRQDLKNQTEDEVMHHFMIMNPNTPLKLRQKLIEQQVEQQDQAIDGRSQENNSSQNDTPNRTLSRFKDWRDASSRSGDASTSSSLPTYRQPGDRVRGNVSWLPYDLSTGGSSKSIDSIASKKMNFGKSNNDKSVDLDRSNRDYSDFSITRSGLNSYGRTQPSGKSTFMTRSSAAHDESTTSSPASKDEQLNQEVSEEVLGTNDGKALAEGTENELPKENQDISQEAIEAQLMATEKPKAPMDYFSSYKTEYSSPINLRRRWPTKTKLGTSTGKSKDMKASTPEDLGAMWA